MRSRTWWLGLTGTLGVLACDSPTVPAPLAPARSFGIVSAAGPNLDYEVAELPYPGVPWAINESGQIAGQQTLGGHTVGFFLADGAIEYIEDPDYIVVASGLNEIGTVVGSMNSLSANELKGFTYSAGQIHHLPAPDAISAAMGINDDGVISGYATRACTPPEVCLTTSAPAVWTSPDGLPTVFESLAGFGADINNAGQVAVFEVGTVGTTRRCVRLEAGGATVFGAPERQCQVRAINAEGWIAGSSWPSAPPAVRTAFVWNGFDFLDLFAAGDQTFAYDINDDGHVVGGTRQTGVSYSLRPILWREGVAVELPMPDGFLQAAAYSINNRGVIAGNGVDALGSSVMLLWAPALPGSPAALDDCLHSGWLAFGFKNQGQCVRFVKTSKDRRGGE